MDVEGIKNKVLKLQSELRVAEAHTVNALNHLRDLKEMVGKEVKRYGA